MGNRAVITTSSNGEVQETNIGIYLHWNGGLDSVAAFLAYCELKGHRAPSYDCYGWARLAQVIGNYFGGTTSLGIDICGRLDCNNGDHGTYFIDGWKVIGRQYKRRPEQDCHNLYQMLRDIDSAQPENERIPELEVAIDELIHQNN
jgi:hypothetical protein